MRICDGKTIDHEHVLHAPVWAAEVELVSRSLRAWVPAQYVKSVRGISNRLRDGRGCIDGRPIDGQRCNSVETTEDEKVKVAVVDRCWPRVVGASNAEGRFIAEGADEPLVSRSGGSGLPHHHLIPVVSPIGGVLSPESNGEVADVSCARCSWEEPRGRRSGIRISRRLSEDRTCPRITRLSSCDAERRVVDGRDCVAVAAGVGCGCAACWVV